MAQTYDTFWQQRFAKKLDELISGRMDALASGNMENFAEYKWYAGVIDGLRMAFNAIEDVNAEIKKAEAGRQ